MSRILRLALLLAPALGGAVEVAWPTAMPRPDIRQPETFVQPTASGKLESGLFGMTRNDGTRFHEGVDIRPLAELDARHAVDPISIGVIATPAPAAQSVCDRLVGDC